MKKNRAWLWFIFACLSCSSLILHGQAIDTPFGKNRVQFHDDFKYWSMYETQNFIVYWYGKSKNIGMVAAQMAELDHEEIRKTIEHKISDKIEILVFVDVNDLKQSNIGAEEAFHNKSGETKILGSKIFVYFDGNHHHLRQQIKEGIASVYLSAMMFGSNFQEILQNALLLEVPEWYAKGIIAFSASKWDIYADDELRDILHRNDKWLDFNKLINDHPKIGGQALWYYIQQYYGKSAISNILYLTRISRDVDNAFQFVLNTALEQVINECQQFYLERYNAEGGAFDLLDPVNRSFLKNKKHIPISAISYNASGSKMAYAVNQLGKTKVYVYDTRTKKSKRIFTTGFKNALQATDYQYPHFMWYPNGQELLFSYQSRDKLFLVRYDVETEQIVEQILPESIQRVYGITYFDERYLIFSAATEGMSDLYIYDTKNREIINITQDQFDDLDPVYGIYNGTKGVFFASNRLDDHILPLQLDTIVPIDNFDIFFLPFDTYIDKFQLQELPKFLERITDTPNENERQPLLTKGNMLVLNDGTGLVNSQLIDLSSLYSRYINNHGRNIILHSVTSANDQYSIMLYNEGSYEVHDFDLKKSTAVVPHFTSLYTKSQDAINQSKQEADKLKKDEYTPGMMFQSRFPDPPNMPEIQEKNKVNLLPYLGYQTLPTDMQKEANIIKIKSNKIRAAGLRFKLADFTTRLDNSVLFEGLELFQGQSNRVNQLPMGLLFKASVDDLFEDYSFEGGARYPTTFNGSEYFMFFENDKKLIDKKLGFYRRSLTERIPNNFGRFERPKKETMIGMYQLKYPFDIYSSIKAISSLRLDRAYFKSTTDQSFNAPVNRDKRLGLRLEYVFDNSLDFFTNVKHGSRAKVFIEGYNLFEFDIIDGFDFDASKGFTGIIGFDGRHYIPVLKHSVLALRVSGAKSFGSLKNMYMLGDVNNTIIPTFDDNVPIPDDPSFAFKTNVNHIRGFRSNIRNGSSYLLGNMEFRLALFRYFLPQNKGATILRDFQLVGFADAGVAWYGASPYDEANPINTIFVDGPIAQLEIRYFRDPLVWGYGMGFRTTLLGYYVRIDRAWGVETRQRQDPIWHFSIGFDF